MYLKNTLFYLSTFHPTEVPIGTTVGMRNRGSKIFDGNKNLSKALILSNSPINILLTTLIITH